MPRTSLPDVAGKLDPVGLVTAMGRVAGAQARHPRRVGAAVGRHLTDLGAAASAATVRSVGLPAEGPAAPAAGDRRFGEAAWQENGAYYGLMQAYLLNCRLLAELVESSGLEGHDLHKARFTANVLSEALSPTNFLPTNPAALRRAAETGGLSLARGLRNLARDVRRNGGWPRQVDDSAFEVGRNMAASAGQVVFRNDLIELIQFTPATPQVHQIPMLICPPWINKYYIVDLAPGKSLVEWAVSHGITTFCISYRNPDASMRDFGFEDYLLKGPRTAIDVVRAITRSDTVNTLSVCLGGTLGTALLAYLRATGDDGLVSSSTTLNCLVDHEGAGLLSNVFCDESTVGRLEKRMSRKGYLEASDMARTFDVLRPRELIFNYVASGWLQGETPPAFDLLAWNADSTRMPAKMHSFFLRECWIDNALAQDRMELAGHRLIVSTVDVPSYIVAAVDDHIVPWRSSYKTTQLLKGDCRFVLSSSGHIAGIVNPPGPKARLWTNNELPTDPDEWRAAASEHHETWWNDWLEWITPRSGKLVDPPALGGVGYPPLGPAPGTFVLGR